MLKMFERNMLEIDIHKDITGDDYRTLIELAFNNCDKFAFVKRRDMMADERLAMRYHNEIVKDIENSLIEMKEQNEWEVTKLYDGTAYVFYYELNKQTKEFLQEKSDSLFGWLTPFLPEDLTFYNGNQLWLASCSHEKFFIISNEFKGYEDFLKVLKNV